MLVYRPIRCDLKEQEDRIPGLQIEDSCRRGNFSCAEAERKGGNTCEGLTAHDQRAAAEQGNILLTGRVAERQRHASTTAHQCNWRCRRDLCYPFDRGREAFLPLGISPS
jgi:hypothetical protein